MSFDPISAGPLQKPPLRVQFLCQAEILILSIRNVLVKIYTFLELEHKSAFLKGLSALLPGFASTYFYQVASGPALVLNLNCNDDFYWLILSGLIRVAEFRAEFTILSSNN